MLGSTLLDPAPWAAMSIGGSAFGGTTAATAMTTTSSNTTAPMIPIIHLPILDILLPRKIVTLIFADITQIMADLLPTDQR
jgi:hypothetical protein